MFKISYNHLSKIFNKIVKKYRKNTIIFNIPYLHFVREHPKFAFIYPEVFKDKYFLKREEYSFSKKVKKNLHNLRELPKKKHYKTLTYKDALIITNLVNENDILTNYDNYTFDLQSILKKKKISSLKIYRNFTDKKFSINSNKIVLPKLNYLSWEIMTIIKILIQSIKIKFFDENKDIKLNKIENYFLKKASNYINLFGSLNTLRILKQIQDIVDFTNPKFLFLPIEGHVWEKSLIKNIKTKYKKIKVIGIQFSSIIKNDHTIKKSYGKIYEPHILICNNYLNYLIIKKNKLFRNSKILFNNLSLNKIKKQKIKNFKKISCLIAPELNMIEVNKFIFLIKQIKLLDNKINFTLNLHPQTHKKNYQKIKKELKNISIVSQKKLDIELNKNNILIYRGSTACLKALQKGLWLLYYNSDEYDINPLKEIKLNKNYFFNHIEFIKIIDYLKNNKKNKINKILNPKKNQSFLNENQK